MTVPEDFSVKETSEELYRLRRAVKDSALDTRISALLWLKPGRSVEEVSEILEVPPRTLERWIAWYRKGGVPELLRRRQSGPGRPTLLTEEQQKILRDKLSTGTLRSAREVMDWVYEVFGIKYTRAGMKTLLQRMARPEGDSTGGQ